MNKPSQTQYDCIVVGAGIEGSATAYNLVKKGIKTLLLEQFPLPHTRGSSHGATRITRMAYDKYRYMEMMPDSHQLWKELEVETGQTLLRKSGLLWMGLKTEVEVMQISNYMKKLNLQHDLLSSNQVCTKFPQLQFSDEWIGIFDPEGAILYAWKCLIAFQKRFVQLGGIIHDGEPVIELSPGEKVTVKTSIGNIYTGSKIVICAGPWTNKIIGPLGIKLPLMPQAAQAMYWKADERYSADNDFPCFYINTEIDDIYVYGLPIDEYPGLIKCAARGPVVDPDNRDSQLAKEDIKKLVKSTRSFLKNHFPGVDSTAPNIEEQCIYTTTPDMDFIMDYHPKYKNIIIGAGFSGHGFKLAPVIGTILSNLVTNTIHKYDMSPYTIARFNNLAAKI